MYGAPPPDGGGVNPAPWDPSKPPRGPGPGDPGNTPPPGAPGSGGYPRPPWASGGHIGEVSCDATYPIVGADGQVTGHMCISSQNGGTIQIITYRPGQPPGIIVIGKGGISTPGGGNNVLDPGGDPIMIPPPGRPPLGPGDHPPRPPRGWDPPMPPGSGSGGIVEGPSLPLPPPAPPTGQPPGGIWIWDGGGYVYRPPEPPKAPPPPPELPPPRRVILGPAPGVPIPEPPGRPIEPPETGVGGHAGGGLAILIGEGSLQGIEKLGDLGSCQNLVQKTLDPKGGLGQQIGNSIRDLKNRERNLRDHIKDRMGHGGLPFECQAELSQILNELWLLEQDISTLEWMLSSLLGLMGGMDLTPFGFSQADCVNAGQQLKTILDQLNSLNDKLNKLLQKLKDVLDSCGRTGGRGCRPGSRRVTVVNGLHAIARCAPRRAINVL